MFRKKHFTSNKEDKFKRNLKKQFRNISQRLLKTISQTHNGLHWKRFWFRGFRIHNKIANNCVLDAIFWLQRKNISNFNEFQISFPTFDSRMLCSCYRWLWDFLSFASGQYASRNCSIGKKKPLLRLRPTSAEKLPGIRGPAGPWLILQQNAYPNQEHQQSAHSLPS